MAIAYDYSMAVLLAVLVLLNVMNLIVGVLAVVTSRCYYPAVIRRLRRRRTPDSAEDERMWGMSLTLSSVAGLVISLQLGVLVMFITTRWPGPHTLASALATLTGLAVVSFVDL